MNRVNKPLDGSETYVGCLPRTLHMPEGNDGGVKESASYVEWNKYKKKYTVRIRVLAEHTDKLIDRMVRSPNVTYDEGFVKTNAEGIMSLFKYLEDYFIQSSLFCREWIKPVTYRVTETADRNEGLTKPTTKKIRVTQRSYLFMELAKVRVSLLECRRTKRDGYMDFTSASTYGTILVTRKCMLSHEKTVNSKKYISCYSQAELLQAFRTLFYRWNICDYCNELGDYANKLLDRLVYLVTFPNNQDVMDAASMRARLVNFTKNVSNDQNAKGLFVANFAFLYRCELLYYHTCSRLAWMQNAAKRLMPALLIKDRTSLWRDKLKILVDVKAAALHSTANNDLRAEALSLYVPSVDREWINYLYPTALPSNTNILEKLHTRISTTITEEANKKINDVIKDGDPSNVALYEFAVLKTIDKIFHRYFLLWNTFVVQYKDIQKNLERFKKGSDPFLIQTFSRYHLYYEGELIIDEDIFVTVIRLFALIINGSKRDNKMSSTLSRGWCETFGIIANQSLSIGAGDEDEDSTRWRADLLELFRDVAAEGVRENEDDEEEEAEDMSIEAERSDDGCV